MFVLDVSGIGCSSCVSKITKAIQSLDNKATVSVDRNAEKVNIELTFLVITLRAIP